MVDKELPSIQDQTKDTSPEKMCTIWNLWFIQNLISKGNPHRPFIDMVLEVKPEQVTLVPDADDAITSNAGWDCEKNLDF